MTTQKGQYLVVVVFINVDTYKEENNFIEANEMYVKALADFDLTILLPMIAGLGVGAVLISLAMNLLFKRFYTLTFSVIFGVFISMIPNMLNETCVLSWNLVSLVSILVMILGFLVSFYLGDLENNNRRLKKCFGKDA